MNIDVLKTWLQARCKTERGASLVEYALLVALIAIVCFSAIAFFGKGSGNSVDTSKNCIEAAYDGNPLPDNCKK